MSESQLVVTCDLGTTGFRGLVAEAGPRGLRVLGAARVEAAGFQDGDFVDLRAGSRAVARLVRRLESAADVDVSGFYYNVSGSHLRSVRARGQVQVGPAPRPVAERDLEAVMAKARSLAVPFDSHVLAVNPVEYTVDRVRGIVDPVGRIGSQLTVDAHLITGARSVVRNVEHAVELAGYGVAGRAVDSLAAAAALVDAREREDGVLLLDVGGWATAWVALLAGRIVGHGSVPWGGAHLTADLAHGLRIERDEAERVKREQGVALRSLVEDASPDVLFDADRPEHTPGLIAAVLEPRLEEILDLVCRQVTGAVEPSALGGGVVLTGGGSRCRGSERLCEEVFGLPAAARYLPPRLAGADQLGEGQWATAVGLAIWAAGEPAAPAERPDRPPTPSRSGRWGRLRRWLGRAPAGDEGPG